MDPFNVIDLARSKETEDRFRNYLANPQHWNKYAYGLNNPAAVYRSNGTDGDSLLLDRQSYGRSEEVLPGAQAGNTESGHGEAQ